LPHFVQDADTQGRFFWIPDSGDAGDYSVSFTVCDLAGLVDTQSVQVSIRYDDFIRGDPNADLLIRMSDVTFILRFLYVPESPEPSCMDAADILDNGEISMTDAIYMLRALYVPGSPPIPPPHPICGSDPTEDELPCNSHPCQESIGDLTDRSREGRMSIGR
jgi:hypothetical protein